MVLSTALLKLFSWKDDRMRRESHPGKESKGEAMTAKLPFTCPICGKKKEYAVEEMVEGARLKCPFCGLELTLHGHMWQEVQEQLRKLKAGK
jgi:transcription elongation factor Elf1